ncbi:MAG: YceI family protein [Candidatus Limnocylindria bacterium]
MTWNLDAARSAVTFTAKHMMITSVRGGMRIRDLDLAFDPERLDSSSVRVSLDAATIDTGQAGRDQHLRSDEFLAVEQHPTIDFVSTSAEGNGTSGRIHGDLTIRGTTRPVVLDVEYAGLVRDMEGGHRVAFAARTKINREDFGLTWNVALEQGGWLVGKEILVEMEIAAVSAAVERAAA